MNCADSRNYIPWLINGSLEAEEAIPLRAHLATCSDCRRELRDWLRSWELMCSHVTAEDLSRYGLGLPTSSPSELIESHLQFCSSCNSELDLVKQEDVEAGDSATLLPFETRQKRLSTAGRRVWVPISAAAAALLAAVALLVTAPLLEPTDPADPLPVALREDPSLAPSDGTLLLDGFESGEIRSWTLPRLSDEASEEELPEGA